MWRAILQDSEAAQKILPEAFFVGLEQVNRLRSMMAASPTRDAVGAAGIRIAGDWRQTLSGHCCLAIAGATLRRSARSVLAVARFLGSRRSVEKSSSATGA
jgi:hypothetical protein